MSILDQILALSNPLATLDSYFSQLYPASWNGVPFFTEGNDTDIGRRNVEHTYPFRDIPWQEDIGRKSRKYNLIGFIVGDDVISQRDLMQTAAEIAGPGTLVHPTYGTLTLSILSCQFRAHKSHGRVIEINFQFGESGAKIYPSQGVSTGVAVTNAGSDANQAMSDDFATQVTSSLQEGASVVSQAFRTVSSWTGIASTLGNDATNIFHLASGIIGPFGRFFGGSTGSSSGSISGSYVSPSQLASQVANLTNTSIADRGQISSAVNNISSVAEGL
jgi:prophage DNA circulation protein